jgi:uncharacterized protein (DUF433 family)
MTAGTITASPDILGGTPVFAGTRVPVQTFIEYIKARESIEAFSEGFPLFGENSFSHSWTRPVDRVLASVL